MAPIWELVVGYHINTLTVIASVSRHNSERDRLHDELWDELVERIEALCNDPKYADIYPAVSGVRGANGVTPGTERQGPVVVQ